MKVTNEGIPVGKKVSIIWRSIRGTVHAVGLVLDFASVDIARIGGSGDQVSWNCTYIGVTHLPRKPDPWQQEFGHQSRINCDQKRRPTEEGREP
jgi:hypothetical protein